ncbi:MAG: DUF4184 family protein [Actinobacteria bacterium]|nr:DUF4184 family protein [Actinomycetota bacterium]MBU4417099.1 DUF4184 family protein [Actinomycetota bacterium]
MPFTPSHIAAVLPLRRLGVALPLAALAAGSMSPDAPYYVPGLSGISAWTHQPWATASLDVVIGLGLWVLWRSVANPLGDLAPSWVRERWRPAGWRSTPAWTVALAVALGAATHVFWDSFTHAGRWGSTQLAFLAVTYPNPLGGTWPGHQWAQYLSGAIGLAIIAWVGWRQPRMAVPAAPPSPLKMLLPWLLGLTGLAGAVGRIVQYEALEDGAGAVAFNALTGGLGAAALVGIALCWLHGWRSATLATRAGLLDSK